MQAVGLHALHGFDVAVLCRALPEITVQLGRERVRDLRGLHGVVPLEKRRAYIPQLHGGKQCDPDGPAGQTRQPCERWPLRWNSLYSRIMPRIRRRKSIR